LGAEICRTLAKQGRSIVCHYRNSSKEADEIVSFCRSVGVQAESIQGDFSSQEGIHDFMIRYKAQFQSTECLINNVGNYLLGPASQVSLDNFYSLFQSNVAAPFVLSQGLIDSLKATQGQIINIGTAGLQASRADTHSPIYRATKMALLSLTKSLARELAGDGVRVNMVSPGYLVTSEDLPADISKLPMKRATQFEEVAAVITFLLQKESRSITGQNIEVAGGVAL
ncbi:MAG TPA: SDR family oxidoreductase, partial [Chlamydiales bacterium]|nr:SDR family oxidoreductase [Chlamydiales bacterium]